MIQDIDNLILNEAGGIPLALHVQNLVSLRQVSRTSPKKVLVREAVVRGK